jgi:hypothetical protein
VTITWNTNSSNTSTWKFPSITSSSGVSFTASQVAIQGKLAGQRFTCQVKHDPSASHQNRTVKGEQGQAGCNHSKRGHVRAGRTSRVNRGQGEQGQGSTQSTWDPELGPGRLRELLIVCHLCPSLHLFQLHPAHREALPFLL